MHGGRNIQSKDFRIGVTGSQLSRAVARAAAGIHNEIGRVFNVLEPGKHAVQYLVLQDRRLIVAGRGALECLTHLAFIDYMVVVHFIESKPGMKRHHSRYEFMRMGQKGSVAAMGKHHQLRMRHLPMHPSGCLGRGDDIILAMQQQCRLADTA
jgi:hypothetical protein